MIQIQFPGRIFFIIVKTKAIRSINFVLHSRNTSRYGNINIRVLGARIWNSLPENIKSTDSVYKLKNFLKGWYVCKCYLYIAELCHLRSHVIFPIHIKIYKNTISLYHYAQIFLAEWKKRRVMGGLSDLIRFLETVYVFLFFTCILFWNFTFVYYQF